jgi:transcriptional regulator with XRE-family HTH domain
VSGSATHPATTPERPRRRRRLALRREVVGYSQEGLAEAIGVDRSTIARWEYGQTNPLPVYRPRLAEALNVSLEDLAVLIPPVAAHQRVGETHPAGTVRIVSA